MIDSIIKIGQKRLPWRVRNAIAERARRAVKEESRNAYFKVPRTDLDAKHIANLKPLPNRFELLEALPKNGIVAEIGVANGEFSEQILKRSKPKKLCLIDAWDTDRYSSDIMNSVKRRFSEQVKTGQVEILQGLSTDVGKTFEDGSFDWVYIDTDHSYPTTRAELELYSRKIKPGGFMAGHDYIAGSFWSLVRYGVKEAVHEFCKKSDYELTHVTFEQTDFPSFAIKKMKSSDA